MTPYTTLVLFYLFLREMSIIYLSPFNVILPKKLEVQGVILSDQIKNLDFTAQEITFICKAPNSIVEMVQKNLLALVVE